MYIYIYHLYTHALAHTHTHTEPQAYFLPRVQNMCAYGEHIHPYFLYRNFCLSCILDCRLRVHFNTKVPFLLTRHTPPRISCSRNTVHLSPGCSHCWHIPVPRIRESWTAPLVCDGSVLNFCDWEIVYSGVLCHGTEETELILF